MTDPWRISPTANTPGIVVSNAPQGSGHVDRVVAGSLIGGVAAAVFVVAVPLAGRTEAVITGSVLITFAAAWFALALASARWTDQPQRWAFVPGVCMAIAGGVVLVLGPTGNELGWIWPPVVMALAVWIVVRARRDLHTRTRTLILYPVCLALALSCIGGAYETYRESTDSTRCSVVLRRCFRRCPASVSVA